MMWGDSWKSRTLPLRAERQIDVSKLSCSFCGKRRDAVASIVSGPTPAIAICNECVELCAEIIAEQDAG